MMLILALAAYVIAAANFWLTDQDWRRAAILAACLWGVAVVVITDDFRALLVRWGVQPERVFTIEN